MLLNYHIGRFVLVSLCVGNLVRLGLSSIRVAGSNTAQRNENKTTNVVIQQHSRKLLMIDILMSETRWLHKKYNKIASDINLVFYSSAVTMMHGLINIRLIQLIRLDISYSFPNVDLHISNTHTHTRRQ